MTDLFTPEQKEKLLQNGNQENYGKDHYPVVKLFTPDSGCTWLLTDLDPEDPDIAFGLCDLGMGFPELGNVSLSEITSLPGNLGLQVVRVPGQFPAPNVNNLLGLWFALLFLVGKALYCLVEILFVFYDLLFRTCCFGVN